MGNYKIFLGLFGFCALSVSAGAALAATAGHAQFINGNVQITDSAGRIRALQKGDAVNEGDMITSAKAASAQIRMQDGGFVAVRPETQLKFDQFNFKGKEDGSERGFFSLLKGGFRAVTGLIGRTNKENYRVTTPAATIGIRGTDHESFFAPVNLPGALAGAYSKVNVGETSLTTNVGTVYVKPNQMGYAGGLNQPPQLQPVNTNIFTVAPAPAKEVKKEERKTAGGENGKGETQKAVAAPAETEEVRSTAVVDSTGAAETGVAVAAPTTGGTVTDEVVIVLPTEEVVPIELVDLTTGTFYNATDQTITSSSGQTASIQNGTYDVLAQAAADAAMAAWVAAQTAATLAAQTDTTLAGVAQVSTVPASTAISSANSVIGTASPLVSSALALTPADATAAASNVASAQAAATTVASQASAAQTAVTGNGIFADSTAITANNLINTPTTGAAALVQSAKTNVEAAASTVTAQNTALTAAQTAASSALNGASTSVTTANGLLATANSQNTAIGTAQTSVAGLVAQAQAAEAAALTAKDNAQTAADSAASLQAAGDFTGAAAQLTVAQDQQTIAQQQQAIAESAKATLANQLAAAQAAQTAASTAVSTATTAANTAAADAGTGATGAQTYAAAAQTAASSAAAALAQTVAATTGTAANTVQVQAGIVAANAPITVYSNPAINTALGGNDGFGHWALATRPAPKEEFIAMGLAQPQTTYVLDGNKDLIEIRNSEIDGNGYNYFNPSPVITGANIKLSGGAANDHFQFADNTGYMGRWRGGNIDVNGSPYIALGLPGAPGTTSIHWGIFLSPSAGYVQNLIGTANYTLVASTHPTDSFGNTGTLNSAFINANFTTQTLDTGVNLSFSTSDIANVSLKNMAFTASATGVPIAGSGFDASPAAIGSLAFGCIGADCDPNGYQGDIVGQFVGADAIHAALGYSIHAVVPLAPTTGSDPHADLIHGMAAFSTATAPVPLPLPLTVAGNLPVWTNLYSYEVVAASGVPGAYNIVNPFGSSLANTVYGLDAANNLLEVNIPASTKEYFSGGTAQDTWVSAGNTIYMGRWQGGSLTTLDDLGQPIGLPVALGAGSAHWIVSANIPPGYAQSLIGTATYTLAMATAPTDALGNAGSLLNTSTITADFTTQLVNMALNIQFTGARSSAFTVSTPSGIAIGGDTIWGGGTVTCTGTCDAGGYSSNLWGRFAGATASEVALAYHIDATSSADIIQGAAAFATATAPTVLTGGPFAAYVPNHVAVEFASSIGWWWDSLLVDFVTYSGGGLSSLTQQDLGCCQTQTFNVIGGATPVTADATSFTATGIQFGRWTSVTALESAYTEPLGQFGWGGRQAWMYGPMGYLDPGITTGPSGQMYGTFSYALDGSTAPFDRQSGQKGTLTGASISANFAANTFSANLALNVANQFWSASAANVPMGGNQFWASSYPGGVNNNLTVSLGAGAPAACPTCYGSLAGAFTGQNYAGAILSYNLWDDGNLGGDVSGNAALVRTGTAISNGTPQTVFNYFVAESGGSSSTNIQTVDTLNSTAYTQVLNPGGVLTSYSVGNPAVPTNFYSSATVSCPGCTVSSTANTPNTGIYFGAWDAGSFANTWGGGIGSASPHWITGPEAGPLFLPQALIGTKTFAFDGGMVTNSIGVAGTVQGTTALTVNFTKQAVGINIDLAINDTSGSPHTWKAQTLAGNEAAIRGGNGIGGATFHASSYNYNSSGTGLLTVTVDGAAPGNGNVAGQLTGAGLNGAIMSFDLNWNPASPPFFQQVSGVAALVAPNQAGAPGGVSDVATPYRWVMTSLATPDQITKSHLLGIYANDPTRMTFSGSNLTKFDMSWIDDRGKGSSETVAINTTTPPVLANAGSDTLTGISWGRWDGGSGDGTNRVTNVTTTHPLAGSMHWIAGPTATAPVTLPVSGTFTYTNAGGTSPTDNLGNVGTLNSATLQADFTNLSVNMGVNVSVGGTTLNASATNAPIIQKTAFWAGSNAPATSPSHLTVTCSAGCGASHQGTIVGGFGGVGATGAMMAYGLEKISGASTQVISGVVGFHR